MLIKNLFFENQYMVSLTCQWQHMLPASQNPEKCSKLSSFCMWKLCWQVQHFQASSSCRGNLMSYVVLCFLCCWYFKARLILVLWNVHTWKEVLPQVVSDCQIGSIRHMGEVDSGLRSILRTNVQWSMIYWVLLLFFLYRNQTQFVSIQQALAWTAPLLFSARPEGQMKDIKVS